MKKLFKLTTEGIKELQTELDELISQREPIAEAIRSARELGDLAENAEYHAAKDQLQNVEARISEIEYILGNVEVIKEPTTSSLIVLGSEVKLKSEKGVEKTFQVVGTVEADPLNGKISDESPIGKALLGRKVGEDIEIKTPAETISYKIINIE